VGEKRVVCLISSSLLFSLWVFQTASEDEMLSSSCSFMTIGSACTPISPILIFLSEKKTLECSHWWSTEAFLQLEICTLTHTHTQSLHPLFLSCVRAINQKGK
jgi:hypothetical protein